VGKPDFGRPLLRAVFVQAPVSATGRRVLQEDFSRLIDWL
jgi:hypothetical protein